MFNPGRNTKHQIPTSREVPESKHQKPSSKHQINPKFQAPNRGPRFELGTWSLSGVWSLGLGASLEFGVWSFNSHSNRFGPADAQHFKRSTNAAIRPVATWIWSSAVAKQQRR